MIDLFEAASGRVSKLPDMRLDDARMHANALLGSESFRCFGLNKQPLQLRQMDLITAIGNISSMPADGDYGVKVANERRRMLGCDVIKGKLLPPDKGTTYERPIAASVEDQDKRRVLAGKTFAYIPLDNNIEISLGPEHTQEVRPGHVFLSEPGVAHTVRIPSGLIAVELVMGSDELAVGDDEADPWHDEWLDYLPAQSNPNI